MRFASPAGFACFLLIVALTLLVPMRAEAKRIALVAGIKDYPNLHASAQLTRSVNDARSVAGALRMLGFELMLIENAGRSEFNESWQQFLGTIEPGDEVAFFFSGHGVEIEGQNFLVPADIPQISFGRQEQIKRESLSLSELLLDLRRREPRVSLVILDACRDHPLAPPEWKSADKPGGLAKMDAAAGTFIMYSAWAGERALDRLPKSDPDPMHSVYTRKLLPLLTQPGLNLTEMAKRVRREVHQLAATVSHPQTPAYYDGILGDYCLAGCESPPQPQQGAKQDDISDAPPKRTRIKALDRLSQEPAAAPPEVAATAKTDEQLTPPAAAAPTASEDPSQRLVRTFSGHSGSIKSAIFSSDGRFALSGGDDNTVRLWEVGTEKELHSFVAGHSGVVDSVAFSSDGILALSGGQDKTLRLWDVSAGRLLRSFPHADWIRSVAFSADGRLAFSASGKSTLKVWDTDTGKELRSFALGPVELDQMIFSPARQSVLTGGYDTSIKLWDINTGKEIRSFAGPPRGMPAAGFSRDGRYAVTVNWRSALQFWDVKTGKELRTFTEPVDELGAAAVSPDGRFAVAAAGRDVFKLWDTRTGKELRSFSGASSIACLDFSPDGRFLLSCSGNTLKLWDLSEWTQQQSQAAPTGSSSTAGAPLRQAPGRPPSDGIGQDKQFPSIIQKD